MVNIESFLKDLPGVDGVQVNFAAERVTIQYDPAQITVEKMQKEGEDGSQQLKHDAGRDIRHDPEGQDRGPKQRLSLT